MGSEAKMSENFYNVLGIEETASQDDIKKAFRMLTKQWHPDRNVNNVEHATEKYKKITRAYEVLYDEQTRRQYDIARMIASISTERRERSKRKSQNTKADVNSGNQSSWQAQSNRIRRKRRRMKRSRMYRRRANVSGQSPESPRFTLDGLSREAYDSYLRKVNENHEYFQQKMREVEEKREKALEKVLRNLGGNGKENLSQPQESRFARKRPCCRSSRIFKENSRNCCASDHTLDSKCSHSPSACDERNASKHPCNCSMLNPKSSIHCKSSKHDCICSMTNPRASIYCKASKHTCVCSMFVNPAGSIHCKSSIHTCICTNDPNSKRFCKSSIHSEFE